MLKLRRFSDKTTMARIWKKSSNYFRVKSYTDLCVRMSFSEYEVCGRENIPDDGLVIYAPNHCNTLMDALVVLAANRNATAFGARADIFHKPRVARLLRWMKILPIARARDGRDAVAGNLEIFDEVVDCIRNGVPFCIFPEGTHRTMHSIQPLKKGVVKIAEMAAERQDRPVYIVPVGLDYEYYFTYMCKCRVSFGAPIEFHKGDDPTAMLAELYRRISELILFFPDNEDYDIAYGAWKKEHPVKRNFSDFIAALLLLPVMLLCGAVCLPILIVTAILIARLKDKAWSNTVRFGVRFFFTPLIWVFHSGFYYSLYRYKKLFNK